MHEWLDVLDRFIRDAMFLEGTFQETSTLRHPTDQGNEREHAVRAMVGKYIQCRAAIYKRAEIEDSSTRAWFHQQDIVLADPAVEPHRILKDDGRVYTDPSAVHTAIEVKSMVDSEVLGKAMQSIADVQTAPRRRQAEVHHLRFPSSTGQMHYVPTSGGVFAYGSTSKRVGTVTRWIEGWYRDRSLEEWPKFVTIADLGHFMWCDPRSGNAVPWPITGPEVLMCFRATHAHHPLVALSTHLNYLCRLWWVPGTALRLGDVADIPHGLRVGEAVYPSGGTAPENACEHVCLDCQRFGQH
ncbi:hypothetical protein GCM10018785_65670 [Streptomyces longispororuber]|uniref:DUF6602 domain-containing protein n=1 Tax=Streptomyces longispororuber TaxID=68230 RepID=A0A919A8V5_9ACTN|nr:DUF6602 domain-containing protein [Streptomyces longispororuber]GHE89365.1 hypothetical protein GCM10018785_65670 [Streptomyces longispororuber]